MHLICPGAACPLWPSCRKNLTDQLLFIGPVWLVEIFILILPSRGPCRSLPYAHISCFSFSINPYPARGPGYKKARRKILLGNPGRQIYCLLLLLLLSSLLLLLNEFPNLHHNFHYLDLLIPFVIDFHSLDLDGR